MTTPSRIILIDDNRSWRDALAEYLTDRGFEVRTADGGLSGLTLLEQCDIPLAVIDFNMPGLNGVEVLRRLRERGRDIAVLLLSGEDDPGLREKAREVGARAFLSKSTTPRILLRALLQLLIALTIEVAVRSLFSERGEPLLPGPHLPTRLLPPPDRGLDPAA